MPGTKLPEYRRERKSGKFRIDGGPIFAPAMVKAVQEGEWWTHKGSNLGPLPCEGNALPLSYAS